MASSAIRTIRLIEALLSKQTMGVLDGVREAAARVAASARSVRVQGQAIATYAASLPLDQLRAPALDPTTHYFGTREATLAYVVTLDAINFGSGYFPRMKKRPGMSGYFTVASSLKDCFEAQSAFSAEALGALTQEECARIFGQGDVDDPGVAELMSLFSQALRDLGNYVGGRFDGSFPALLEAAHGSAESLVRILTAMPFYQDVGFYKRAQLTAADLSTAGVAHFEDLDRLTIFADNLVPHVLRVDGILEYDADLLARIEREELIPAGSAEECEIRACALHAVELIALQLRQLGQTVNPMQLDYLLWNRGQMPAYKARPRHRTRTVFY